MSFFVKAFVHPLSTLVFLSLIISTISLFVGKSIYKKLLMRKLYFILLISLLLPCSFFGKSNVIKESTSGKTADTPFITQWDLSKPGSAVTNGTTSLTFGVAVTGAVNYSWTTTDKSASSIGTIPAGVISATINGLPANKTIVLSIESPSFKRFFTGSTLAVFPDRSRLTDVKQWGNVNWSSMSDAFYFCPDLNITATDIPNLTNVSDMGEMFRYCSQLNGPANIDNWDTSNIMYMNSLFEGCTRFDQNIKNWNISKVINMSYMFYRASAFNQNIGSWKLNTSVSMGNMLSNSGIDCINYSEILMGWAADPVASNGRSLDANGRVYGTNAVAARNMLVNTKGWTITGDTAGTVACGTIPTAPDANNILYVNTSVLGGDGSGNSWSNAIKELADALKWANTNKANFTTTPLQIWVAKGTYKPMYRPDTFAGPNIMDRNNSFLMVNNVKLYGGFAGTENTLSDRNLGINSNASILSGDYNNNDVVMGTGSTLAISGNGENVGNVVISAGAVGVAELNGFVVKGGNADGTIPTLTTNGNASYYLIGGGVNILRSNPIIQNCTFKENSAVNAGGAMALYPSSSKVINCIFLNNTATSTLYGGGAVINTAYYGLSNPHFINCTITGNRGTNGGAIYNETSPNTKIYNTIIYGNSSGINSTTNNDIQNSVIQGLSNTNNGNIDGYTNPLFVNPSSGDYRLQTTSPVIDKGSNALYTNNVGNLNTDKDRAGRPRLNGNNIDLGAYEYHTIVLSAPIALPVQIYTGTGTIANLTASGDNLKWYAAATNGTVLTTTTALTDHTKYYVSQTVDNFESARTEVLVKRISDDAQAFCNASSVSNLETTPFPGTTVNWYGVPTGGTPLASNAVITTGDYYVEMQSIISKTLLKNGLQTPEGIASLPDGSIVFANFSGGTIQRMNADGSGLTTLVSNLSYPLGVNLQQNGKLLYTVVGSNLVRRMDDDGSNTQLLSNSFNQPYRAIQQADGKILVADLNNSSIKKMNADGSNVTTFIGAGINAPYSVAEDSLRNIWVADIGNSTIKKYSSTGSLLNAYSVGYALDLKIDSQGRVVFLQYNGELRRMNADGSNLQTLATGFNQPYGLALESNGNILVADSYNNNIYRVVDNSYITNRVKVHITVNNFGAIAYVDKNVTGGNKSGSSWANAAPELADVMRCARTQYDANNTIYDTTPLKVFVAKGTYKPLYNAADGQYKTDGVRNNAFVMVKNVQLYGGFDPANGIDDLTDARIFGDNGSVLSGDYIDNDVVTGTGSTLTINNNGDNVLRVLISSGAAGLGELNGFVVKGGNANTFSGQTVNGYSNVNGYVGGGILINNSNPIIRDCIFKENSAFNAGGGMALLASTSKIINSLYLNNLATNSNFGGGAILSSSSSGLSNPYFLNCTITGNKGANGGAIYNESTPSTNIINTIIYGNSTGINHTINNNIQNSLIQGLSTIINGNIDGSTNPLFVNPSSGDYKLQTTSPVIDKGNSILYSANGGILDADKDLAGNTRLSECTIDIGAYEYQNPEIYVNWDGASWSNTSGPTQSLGACINSNYNLASNFTAKNLKVLNGGLNIKPNNTVKVYGNITQFADNQIILDNDANLIQTDNNAVNDSKKITVKRITHMRQLDYTYWGTPVSSQKLLNDEAINDGFSVGTPNNRIYNYNESDDYFVAATDSHFVPGKGYAIRGKNSFDANDLTASNFQFTGGINNGVYSVTVQKSKNNIFNNNEYEHGYNLIGNPYPSNIDFEKLFDLKTNKNKIFGKVWFWTNVAPRLNQSGSGYNGNNYASLTLTGGSPPTTSQPNSGLTPTQFIKVAQGFIVQVRDVMTTTSPKVTHQLDFDNSIRTDQVGVFYNAKNNTSSKDRFWLQMISPESFTNTILVGYVNGASNHYDGDYDAEVMSIGDDSVYTLLDSQRMQIDGRQYPLSTEDVVLIGTKYAKNGIYKISLGKTEGIFENGQSVYLKDKLLNKTVNISEDDYSFQAVKGTEENRFEIVYKPQTYLDADNETANQLYVYKGELDFVIKSSEKIDQVQLFDMSGRLIKDVLGKAKEVRIPHLSLANGTYLLKIYRENEVVTKKVIK